MTRHEKILLDLINLQMKPFNIHFNHIPAYEYNLDYEISKSEILTFRRRARAYLREIGVPKEEQTEMIKSFLQDYGLKTKQREK